MKKTLLAAFAFLAALSVASARDYLLRQDALSFCRILIQG